MESYVFISPAGYVGRTFQASSDDEAIKIAKEQDGEEVLDLIDYDGKIGLVVAD